MVGPEDVTAMDAEFVEVGEQRRTERRRRDRRAAGLRLDPLFAAVLLRHVSETQTRVAPRGYERVSFRAEKGAKLNLRA